MTSHLVLEKMENSVAYWIFLKEKITRNERNIRRNSFLQLEEGTRKQIKLIESLKDQNKLIKLYDMGIIDDSLGDPLSSNPNDKFDMK